jgi:fucose permease
VIGPPLAGYLNDQAGISPFFVAAAISVMTLLVVVLISDRPTDRVRRAPS